MFKESDEPNIYTDLSPDNKEPKLEKEKPEEGSSSESVRQVSKPGIITDKDLKSEVDRLNFLIVKLDEEIRLRKENKPHHNIEAMSKVSDEQLEKDAGWYAFRLWRLEQEKKGRENKNK